MPRILYSWTNVTLGKDFQFEEKELLNVQRMRGEECINVTNDIGKTKKYIRKHTKK